jgi:hypothetical protein
VHGHKSNTDVKTKAFAEPIANADYRRLRDSATGHGGVTYISIGNIHESQVPNANMADNGIVIAVTGSGRRDGDGGGDRGRGNGRRLSSGRGSLIRVIFNHTRFPHL